MIRVKPNILSWNSIGILFKMSSKPRNDMPESSSESVTKNYYSWSGYAFIQHSEWHRSGVSSDQ